MSIKNHLVISGPLWAFMWIMGGISAFWIVVALTFGFTQSACAFEQIDVPIAAQPWEGDVKFGLEPLCEAMVGHPIKVGISAFGSPSKVETIKGALIPQDGKKKEIQIKAYHFNLMDRGLGYVVLMTPSDADTIVGYAGAEPVGSQPTAPSNPFKRNF